MDRLLKATGVLVACKKGKESSQSRRSDAYEKEVSAFSEVRDVLTRSDIRKDIRYGDEFIRITDIMFDYMNHQCTDLRILSEQTMDSVLRHLIIDMNVSRVVIVLMSEIKKNGPCRSLTFALSRLVDVLKYVKMNRSRAICVHLLSALAKIIVRPEEAVQNTLERCLPTMFTLLVFDSESDRHDCAVKLYELAIYNLELSGVANRTASVIVHQLSIYVNSIRRKSFSRFVEILTDAKDEENRNLLVGTLNSLRLMWPLLLSKIEDFELSSFHSVIRDSLRCLYSSYSDIVVAALEFLDKVFSSSFGDLNFSSFYPQRLDSISKNFEGLRASHFSPPLSFCDSRISSLKASPVNSVFGDEPSLLNLSPNSTQPSLTSTSIDTCSKRSKNSSSSDSSDIMDPLRQIIISDDFDKNYSSSEESLTPAQINSTTIPGKLPTDLSYEPILQYASILLARRFLLSGHCLRLISDRNVRVSHKILAMNCLSNLALHISNFTELSLLPRGGFGVQTMSDLNLYLSHEDDNLKSAAVVVHINAAKSKFRALGNKFANCHKSFTSFIFDAIKIQRPQCSRALLTTLKSAKELVYHSKITDDIVKFACENRRDNYFLLRISVVEYLASVEWASANASSRYLSDEVFNCYMCLLNDSDQRVRKTAAENLTILIKNANYMLLPNCFHLNKSATSICFTIPERPLASISYDMMCMNNSKCIKQKVSTSSKFFHFKFFAFEVVGMCEQYRLDQDAQNHITRVNLSILIAKIFDSLVSNGDEKQQAGIMAGLSCLSLEYMPSQYDTEWGIDVHCEGSPQCGFIAGLLSTCNDSIISTDTAVNVLSIISRLFAGLNVVRLLKEVDNLASTSKPKIFEPSFLDEFLLLQLRVLNLYYSLIVDHRQQQSTANLRSSRLSPVRKALPAGTAKDVLFQQRIVSISKLHGTNVKMFKDSSFLHSSTLTHYLDSYKGAYINYSNNISTVTHERFSNLLVASLRCVSCALEVANFSSIRDLIEEILLYCRTVVEVAPAETTIVIMQLFKVLFGSNLANLYQEPLQTTRIRNDKIPKDLLDVCMLSDANLFTEFVINTGRNEYISAHIAKCIGWLNKNRVQREKKLPSNTIAPYISMFEPLVSLSIRLYQSTNSMNVQNAILDLLCVLVRGGINYSMLDPEMRLLKFVVNQVGEITSRNRPNIESVFEREQTLVTSIFDYFVVLNRADNQGQSILSSSKLQELVQSVINSSKGRPSLSIYGVRCLQVIVLDSNGAYSSHGTTLTNLMTGIDHLLSLHPADVIQIWSLINFSAAISGDKFSWTRVSSSFFDNFQKIPSICDFSSSQSASFFLRCCCPSVTRPVEIFIGKMISILESKKDDCFKRLLSANPYIFMFLCVLKEELYLPKLEQIHENASEHIARLFIELLWECLLELRDFNFVQDIDESFQDALIHYLLELSYSTRSRRSKCITSNFVQYISTDCDDLNCLSLFFPRVYVQLLAFLGALELRNHPLLVASSPRYMSNLCMIAQCRMSSSKEVGDVIQYLESCSPDVFALLLREWLQSYSKLLDDASRDRLLGYIINRVKSSESVNLVIDMIDLIVKTEKSEMPSVSEYLKQKSGLAVTIDLLVSKLTRSVLPTSTQGINKSRSLAMEMSKSSGSEKHVINRQARDTLYELIKCLESSLPAKLDEMHSETSAGIASSPGSGVIKKLLEFAVCTREFLIHPDILIDLDMENVEFYLKKAYELGRFDIVSSCYEWLDHLHVISNNFALELSAIAGELYCHYSPSSFRNAEAIAAICISQAFDPAMRSHLQFYAQNKISERCEISLFGKADNWVTKKEILDHWIERYTDALSAERPTAKSSECLKAITFGITRRSFVDMMRQNACSKECVQQQLSLVMQLNKLLCSKLNKPCAVDIFQDVTGSKKEIWRVKVNDRTETLKCDIDFYSNSAQEAFNVLQNILYIFRKKLLKTYLLSDLENLAKELKVSIPAVIRLPFLNDISCIPRFALLCGWKPELELHDKSISVSLVSIYYLNNVDILNEFMWRIMWAGWNCRTNFDNFSMSLFGVISSTPSGTELLNANIHIAEQLMASTAAVEALTNLLLQTLLFPERGNPVTGHFIIKPRDVTVDFLNTPFGQRIRSLKAILLNVNEDDFIYKGNLEFSSEHSRRYQPGQFSVITSWNMTGVLEEERNLYHHITSQSNVPVVQNMKSSGSTYLFDSGHDTTYESCLRMLFDTFSHWFRAGVDSVPLPLLCATVKSMSLLSDLFTELDQYRFMFRHMKAFFCARSHLEGIDVGNIIYSLLKCLSILGLEEMNLPKVESHKAVLVWVETGLTSSFSEVRMRTLQGCLFILQAICFEEMRPVFMFIQTFIIAELRSMLMYGDRGATNEIFSHEYQTIVWTVGFSFCDVSLHSSDTFRSNFTGIVSSAFLSTLTPSWLMDLMTAGIEKLIIGSRLFIFAFNRLAIQVFESYFKMPQKFVFALRLFIVCIYRGMENSSLPNLMAQPYDSRINLMEQHANIFKILAEGAEEDSTQLLKVLPYLLIDSLNESELINSILKELIHRYKSRSHPRPVAIFTIIHHWFSVLRRRETDEVVLQWTLNGLESFKYVADAALFRFYVNAFLCSSSSNPLVFKMFHLIVGRTENASWLDDFWFPFSIKMILSNMDTTVAHALKDSMELFLKDGKVYKDPKRIVNFPPI